MGILFIVLGIVVTVLVDVVLNLLRIRKEAAFDREKLIRSELQDLFSSIMSIKLKGSIWKPNLSEFSDFHDDITKRFDLFNELDNLYRKYRIYFDENTIFNKHKNEYYKSYSEFIYENRNNHSYTDEETAKMNKKYNKNESGMISDACVSLLENIIVRLAGLSKDGKAHPFKNIQNFFNKVVAKLDSAETEGKAVSKKGKIFRILAIVLRSIWILALFFSFVAAIVLMCVHVLPIDFATFFFLALSLIGMANTAYLLIKGINGKHVIVYLKFINLVFSILVSSFALFLLITQILLH